MPPQQAPPPPAARTSIQEVAGQVNPVTEAQWTVVYDSPIVTAFPFLDWNVAQPPARTAVNRSSLVGVILAGCRPPSLADLPAMRGMSFLTHEMDENRASEFAHAFDRAGALDAVYSSYDDWIASALKVWSNLADPNQLRLTPAAFVAFRA